MTSFALAEHAVPAPALPPLAVETRRALAADGFALLKLDDEALLGAAERTFERSVAANASGSCRLACDDPLVTLFLDQPSVAALVRDVLSSEARPVRALAFDKTEAANWFVPWHQDRSIAVAEQRDCAAVRNWTVKAGVPHCEAPIDLLNGMLTLRWHLDAAGVEDGCLRVLRGSHRLGRLDQTAIRALRNSIAPFDVVAPRGAVMASRPLLVHGSHKRSSAGRRRTLQVEFSDQDPPAPLRWA